MKNFFSVKIKHQLHSLEPGVCVLKVSLICMVSVDDARSSR